ncbi:5-dehydro-2-deoxygluconokinase [Paenibacillus sacheonensis]|uniref:5-dehydro-2-deoxygluconokinase n=1 Tax=Paenibacillus sacheonensis TaxID=742054 RepID=A0A7X5BZ73_9BACL|nr:5-dehydro-2-deoxygluconokinase [Paenibacillus sacheonensis]MBM7566204.1 5-dehydro-2-deoxygluconokinase [Paenibacillus sacheonensis]NBC70412.1 5-dehydro-2-deoxygluconokinase [Paenibacillus sacheonensis]
MNNLSFPEGRLLDFVALGRACVDLNANEIHRPMEDTVTFTKYVGGSPANITIGMARLGMRTGFIGRVSDDQMGRFIVRYFERNGIDTSGMITDRSGSVTGLAFTEIKSPSDCSILMYRDNVADLLLEPRDVDEAYIANAKALLISGTALAKSPSREAVFVALDYARKHGTVVLFDLDYRPYTWASPEETAVYYNLAAAQCDVILGTREEFDAMETFERNASRDDAYTANKWFGRHASIVVIKHGKDGSFAFTKEGERIEGTTFPANVVKTFGAGDSYAAGFIHGLMKGWDPARSMEYGAAAASIVISSHSCSDAMPTLEAIEDYIELCKSGRFASQS